MKNLNLMSLMSMSLVVLGLAQIAASPASADENFRKNHPRRAEVNRRERRQMKRINQGEKSGKITPAQAQQDRQNVRSVKQEERADVKANGGHLTQGEQKQLNQELNQNSQQINQQKQ
ncbi:MAG: hypothetical protein ACXWP5_05935 [Bdellovibrionota bacterium]